jgi:hypothetical protein
MGVYFEEFQTFNMRNLGRYEDRNKLRRKIKIVTGTRGCYGLRTYLDLEV